MSKFLHDIKLKSDVSDLVTVAKRLRKNAFKEDLITFLDLLDEFILKNEDENETKN